MTELEYYEQPAAVLDPPRTLKALRDGGLVEYKAWGWVKMSAKFIGHIRKLKGSKLSTWQVIALSINERGECDLSAPEIAALTDYSVSETRAAIKELDVMGYLSVKRRDGKRSVYSPAFAARSANNPSDAPKVDPSSNSTPLVDTAKRADNPSSLAIENSVPSIKRVKRVLIKRKRETRPPAEKPPKPGKPPMPAEIKTYHEATGKYPKAAVYSEVIAAVQKVGARLGRPATADDLRPFFTLWMTKSNNEYNFSVWLLEWAVTGQTQQKGYANAKPQQSYSQPEPDDAARELAARIIAKRKADAASV